MILKLIHSDSAPALARYASRGGSLEVVAGTVRLEASPGEVAGTLEHVISLNRRCRGPQVLHLVLSPAEQDRALTDADWGALAQDALEGMGLGDCPWAAYLHRENGKVQHLHICTTQVDGMGRRVDMGGERYRARRVARRLELDYGLCRVSNVKHQPIEPPAALPELPLAGTLEPPGRLGVPVEDRLRLALGGLVRPGRTLGDLALDLRAEGIDLVPTWQAGQTKIGGLGFRIGDAYVKASAVGASLKKLEEQGIGYDPVRDIPALRGLDPALSKSLAAPPPPAELPRLAPLPAPRIAPPELPLPAPGTLGRRPHAPFLDTLQDLAQRVAVLAWSAIRRAGSQPVQPASAGRFRLG